MIATDASLASMRADYFEVLSRAIPEIPKLREAIIEGRVEGSTYQGPCACLVGTIANARMVHYCNLEGIMPDAGRPAERFFWAIGEGDTPENSEYSRLALRWLDEFVAEQAAK